MKLRAESENLSKKIRYATGPGDYEMADELKQKWGEWLDDAWFVNYNIIQLLCILYTVFLTVVFHTKKKKKTTNKWRSAKDLKLYKRIKSENL